MTMASARASRINAYRRVGGRSRPRASTSAVTRSGTAISQTRMCNTQPAPTSTSCRGHEPRYECAQPARRLPLADLLVQLARQPDHGHGQEEAVNDQEIRYLRPGILVHLNPGISRGVVFGEWIERHCRHAQQDHGPPDDRDDGPEEKRQTGQQGRAVRVHLRPPHPGAADDLHQNQRGQPGQRIRREVPRVRRPQRAEHKAQQHDRQQIGQGDVPRRRFSLESLSPDSLTPDS